MPAVYSLDIVELKGMLRSTGKRPQRMPTTASASDPPEPGLMCREREPVHHTRVRWH